jgi:hypothetical protein
MININLQTKEWYLDSWNDIEGLVVPVGERKVCPCGDTKLINQKCNHCTLQSYFILQFDDEDEENDPVTGEYRFDVGDYK